MRRKTEITVFWGESPWKPKTNEEIALDKMLALEVLQRLEDREGIQVIAVNPERSFYEVKVEGEKALHFTMEELQSVAHLVSPPRIWPKYTDEELFSAPLLIWGPTNQAIGDDYYDLEEDGYQGGPKASHRRCPACRAELEQVRDLLVNPRKMGKRDLSLTYGFQVILSPRLAQMLQEASFTGFSVRPVWHYRKPQQGDPPLYQLVVTHTLPPMAAPPTEFQSVEHCPTCGTTARFIKHTHYWGRIKYNEDTPIYYPRAVLDQAHDFNRTAELFGELPAADPYVLISQRVYRWLRAQRVKGWMAEPVYFVEEAGAPSPTPAPDDL